jgi:hypothetical protein
MEDIMIVPLEQTDLSKVSMMAVHKSLPIIFIPKIPENLFWVVEELVEYNIEHETLHIVICKLEGRKASKMLDNINRLKLMGLEQYGTI